MPNIKPGRLTNKDIMASMFGVTEELLLEYRNTYASSRVYDLLKIWRELKVELRKRKIIS